VWTKFYEVVTTVVTLAEDLKQNREEIKEIRQELRDLTAAVVRLQSDLEHTKEREATERKVLSLELQNMLIRFEQHIERRLPPPDKP
jgi:predicted  nucleic acid-binding Zn-ribbon protein